MIQQTVRAGSAIQVFAAQLTNVNVGDYCKKRSGKHWRMPAPVV